MRDRVFHQWIRAETPPAGQGKAVALLTVFFPEGHLSPDLPKTAKKTLWLPPPMVGEARFLQIALTREKKENLKLLLGNGQSVVAYHALPNAEAVFMRSWAKEFEQPDLIVEASHGVSRDLVLPSRFEAGVERPIGFSTYSRPDEMRCVELSGYWVPAGEARQRFPHAGSISRTSVIERGGPSFLGAADTDPVSE